MNCSKVCVLKSLLSVCMCECVWGYEAALLFLGQLLVTQEWLICNGCCHSPAMAPGDGCTVTNVHVHTQDEFKTHTNMCTHADSLTHKDSSIPPIQCYDFRQALQHQSSVQPQVTDRQVKLDPSCYIGTIADWIWLDTCIKSSPFLFFHVSNFVCFPFL